MVRTSRCAALSVVAVCVALAIEPCAAGATPQQGARLIGFHGIVPHPAGAVAIVFSFYGSQQGGTPLWRETQMVTVDAEGRYAVSLGTSQPDGVPLALFTSGEARWLGVQVAGQPELPRVLLVSVPYALKAADAETVGGRPLSAFVLAGEQTGTGADGLTYVNTALLNRSLSGVGAGGASSGTPGYLGVFTTTTDLGNSLLYQTAGRVGVGTTAPEAAFHAVGTSAPGALFDLYSDSLTALPVVFRAARGTAAAPLPPHTDDILGGLAVRGWTGTTFSGGRGQVMFKAAENWTATANGTYLSMATVPIGGVGPAAERVRVTPNGRVGIGTAAPGQLLTVAGTIESTTGGFKFPDGTTQTTAVSHGANTFTATQTLSSGNLALPATTGTSSGVVTLDGERFLHAYGATTDPNLFLGGGAGSFGITGSGGNVGIGPSALGAVTGGYRNTAVGASSLASLNIGDSNTAVGYKALRQMTSAEYNTAVGTNALQSVVSNGFNTAVGYDALGDATGRDNSAFGSMALAKATVPWWNNAFGAMALNSTTTGEGNCAFGYESMRMNVGGESNSAFGNGSLKFATGGSYNTAVGVNAGQNVTTGSQNTFIGFGTGTTAENPGLTNATAIGANATVAQNNSLVLGATNVKVGIGTTAPETKLQVVGNIRVGTSGSNGCVQDFSGSTIAGACSSDVRLKTNISPFEPVLARFIRLQPVRFDWRAREFPEYHFGSARSTGLIAQEVERVFPEMVAVDDHGYKTVDYAQLPYLTVAAVRELKAETDARIRQLRAENDALKAQLERLAAIVAELQKRR